MELRSLASLKRYLSEFGLKLVAIEDNPPMDRIRYGIEAGKRNSRMSSG